MGSWYNSRYTLTNSATDEKITSGQVYTLDNALIEAGSNISSSAGFTDEILAVSVQSCSTDIDLYTSQ